MAFESSSVQLTATSKTGKKLLLALIRFSGERPILARSTHTLSAQKAMTQAAEQPGSESSGKFAKSDLGFVCLLI